MTLKIRSRTPKLNTVIALPQGLIYVSLIFLGLILFLESCLQSVTDYTAADACCRRQTKVNLTANPRRGGDIIKEKYTLLPLSNKREMHISYHFKNKRLQINTHIILLQWSKKSAKLNNYAFHCQMIHNLPYSTSKETYNLKIFSLVRVSKHLIFALNRL